MKAIWVLSLTLATSCHQSPEILATFSSQTLTVADLDAYLLSLPEAERQIPVGDDSTALMEQKIRRLALERVLESSEEAALLRMEDPTRGLLLRSSACLSSLSAALVDAATPSAVEVQAKAKELQKQRHNEPLLNFQHIFFRLDRARTKQRREALRDRARAVAAEAKAGADFPTLARRHSDSSDAASGGLVMNAPPSMLEKRSQQALRALAENEVSGVVETRTGLHIFRLVRRLESVSPATAQLEAGARNLLLGESIAAAREALLEDLRRRIEVQTETPPWQIGSWTLDTKLLEQLMPDGTQADQRDSVVDQFLLAEEAIVRGLEPPNLAEDVAKRLRQERIGRLLNQRRRDFEEAINLDSLRAFYETQPVRFNSPEKVRLQLIFIAQGADSFSTQKRVEALVTQLRGGASFAELARIHSTGPEAEIGGDLGLLEPRVLARLGPAVSTLIPSLAPGDVSDPIYCTDRVMTQDPLLLRGGFAVLRVQDRIAERPRKFAQAIEDVRRAYASENRAQLDKELETKILNDVGFKILRLADAGDFIR